MGGDNKSSFKKVDGPVIRLEEGEKWYSHSFTESNPPNFAVDSETLSSCEQKADELLKRDCELADLALKKKGQSDVAWLQEVIKKGTQADKISAIHLKTQMDPVHSLAHVKVLVELLLKKQMREAVPLLTAVKDIFVDELLPPNRKLVLFKDRPVHKVKTLASGNTSVADRRLILWKFEHDLKKVYEDFVRAVDAIGSSSVEAVATHACRILLELVTERPERESIILADLANKLGHPKKVVASKVADCLHDLVNKHSNMADVVVSEVERVVFRKNIPLKAQLYAAHFLTRIQLDKEDGPLAVKLLRIYFSLFKVLIKAGLGNHKICALVMIGANRALPYAKEGVEELMPEIDSLYKIVYSEKMTIALSALKVLYRMLALSESVSDRFYSALYRRLLVARPSAHDTELFHLLEKVVLNDPVPERVKAFIKRILQIALVSNPSFAAASLLLVGKVFKKDKNSIKLSKLGIVKAEKFDDDDDEEEVYHDVDDEAEQKNGFKMETKPIISKGKIVKSKTSTLKKSKEQLMKTGWVHRSANNADGRSRALGYSHEARNPMFANAELTVDTELLALSQHYHPTVAHFAQNLIDGSEIKYNGDALQDFSLIRFLDRFAFKNPKTTNIGKVSVFQHKYNPKGIKKLCPTSKDYTSRKADEIPADEQYLHRFASAKLEKADKKKKKLDEAEDDFDDNASVNSDEFEMIMDRFEPGEANDDFDVNFGSMFGPEKQKDKKAKKRSSEDAEDEDEDDMEDGSDQDADDDDVDEAEFAYSDDDEELDNDDDDDDDDDDEVDDDDEMDDDSDSGHRKRSRKGDVDDDMDADEGYDVDDDDDILPSLMNY